MRDSKEIAATIKLLDVGDEDNKLGLDDDAGWECNVGDFVSGWVVYGGFVEIITGSSEGFEVVGELEVGWVETAFGFFEARGLVAVGLLDLGEVVIGSNEGDSVGSVG